MHPNSTKRSRQGFSWTKYRVALASVLSAIGLTSQAAFLKPTEVVYVSTGADGAPAMIDDANLSDPPSATSTHAEGAGQWTGPGSTKQEIALDLGQTVSLTKIYLWNYLGNTTVGLKDVEVQVSPDATYATANFTAVARIFMTEGGEGVQTFNIVATDARLVRLKILGNWGQGFTVGLGSVRFETGTIAGHVPSVKVTSPAQGDTLTVGSDSIISATVTDADNDIAKVEFFDGVKLLGTDTNAPYSFTVTGGFLFGEHEIRAQATDKSGKVAWSSVNVTAREDSGGKIIQIDDNRDIGDGVNQIKYSDGWNHAPGEASDPRFLHDDHYSFTKDSYFEVKFSGSKIEIYATVASHHGLGTASIDGGDPVDISYAAEQRGEQKFIWASPTLPNRQHTLRVTVKSGAVVTADRFDVTVPSTKIVQIDDNRDIGDGVNQIKYSDGWNLAPGEASDPRFLQNDHYSFTKDSYFEVKFVGTKIDIYATVASHHGLGTATIDGGDPVDISYAAEQRGEQKFIWSSPTLPNRQHILRVTVKSGAVVTADRFDITVPATRLVVIDDNADIGDGVNQIKYSDGWTLAPGEASDPRYQHNDHYSFTKDSYFEVKFFGTKIELYATVASHHGLGSAQIDNGAAVDISYAAAQRGEQKFIWASPVLPNRLHVLRVTVKSGAVVTADRFDIFSSAGASGDLAGVSKIVVKPGSFQIDFKDYETSIVSAPTMELRIDSVKVSAPPKKVGDTTTLLFVPAARFLAGSVHTYLASGRDTLGNTIASQGSFTTPSPPFSESGLGEPKGSAGKWGFRTVWNTGLVNNLEGAVETAGKPSLPSFAGKIQDTTVKVINMGESTNPNPPYGLFADEAALPAESQGLTANDFVVIGHGYVKIPTAGDWTIGVHSDEGFALRFIGAPFDSVSGGGLIDPSYPEYMFNGNNTTDSNTRGILKKLAVGVYQVEFIGWERTGAAHYEVYAAKGAFIDDAESTDWKLIGEAGGLELVQGPAVPPVVTGIALSNGKAVISYTSAAEPAAHQLIETSDLKSAFVPSTGVTYAKGANNVQTATVAIGASPKYYRVKLP